MTVGKAQHHDPDHAHGTGFSFSVPCFTEIDRPAIERSLAEDHFFWLDLTSPGKEEIKELHELFAFHPLALEDALHFGQRPKLDHYGEYVFIVFYGAGEQPDDDGEHLQEVQMFISGKCLVTLHRDPLPALDEQLEQPRRTGAPLRAVPSVPRLRRPDRQLLPAAGGDGRRDRRARGGRSGGPHGRAAPATLRHEALAGDDAQGPHPTARSVRPLDRPAGRSAGTRSRRARLLPRRL